MNPRTPPVLPDLTAGQPPGSGWRWIAASLEPSGRVLLRAEVRDALGATTGQATRVSGVARGEALVLRPAGAGRGRVMTVDRRGRIYLPVWLRRHPSLLIGSRTVGDRVVVIVPAAVLDSMGDQVAAVAE